MSDDDGLSFDVSAAYLRDAAAAMISLERREMADVNALIGSMIDRDAHMAVLAVAFVGNKLAGIVAALDGEGNDALSVLQRVALSFAEDEAKGEESEG